MLHDEGEKGFGAISSPLRALERSPKGYMPSGSKRPEHKRLDSTASLVTHTQVEKPPKRLRRIPFLRRPQDEDGPWLQDGHEASTWLSLFYDLAVVAVLTVFSTTHELSTPGAIPNFLSYIARSYLLDECTDLSFFVIINWIWTAQVHYDTKYQAEDSFHRIAKGLQITLFIYIGAASGNWNLKQLKSPDRNVLTPREAVAYNAAGDSFYIIVVTFAVSRGLLLLQYLVAMTISHRVGRSKRSQLAAIGSLTMSIACSATAVLLHGDSDAKVIVKLTFLYLSVGVEALGMWLQVQCGLIPHHRLAAVKERYAAFTLIILGEGFIAVTRAFNRAISGLSESNTATYGQVILGPSITLMIAIAIIYFLYLFLFGRFHSDDTVKQKRAIAWQTLHLPLHFALLLLLAAMVNTIIVVSFAHGINTVTNEFSISIDYIRNGSAVPVGEQSGIEKYLDKLTLEPTYEVEFEYLNALSRSDAPSNDPTVLGYQYFGQIILQTTISYGLSISLPVLNSFEALYAVDSTWTVNGTLRDIRRAEASALLVNVIRDPVDEALSGVLWLFPCAGAVLILCALRSVLAAKHPAVYHWTTHFPMILFGTTLSLLGLLDIGSSDINLLQQDELSGTNWMFRLLSLKLPLAIVVAVYALVYYGGVIGLRVVHRCRGDVYESEDTLASL